MGSAFPKAHPPSATKQERARSAFDGALAPGALLRRNLEREGRNDFVPLVNKILREVHRVDQSMVECLEFVKPLAPVFRGCRAEEVLEESISQTFSEFPGAEVEVTRDYEPDLPLLPADRGLLQHVFRNILQNALEAMGERGRLRLRISRALAIAGPNSARYR